MNGTSGVSSGFTESVNLVPRSSSATIGDVTSSSATTDVSPTTTTQQVTGFIDDASNMNVSLPAVVSPTLNAIKDSMETRTHSIIDVISRPVEVARGTWTDTETLGTILQNLSFPQAIFDASPNVVDKLNFFAFLRADVCVRVMVNANTFQQGKLLGYFTPFTQYVGERANVSDFISSYTTFPYVINDASVGNSTDLLIPYVAPYSSYRLFDKTGNIGNFTLRVLNGLQSGNCNYTVYAWFTNISVDLPSGLNNALTADAVVVKQLRAAIKHYGNKRVSDRLNSAMKVFKAQIAGETEQKSNRLISSTFHAIHEAGQLVAGIPMLAPVAGPVSWVAKAIAHVAEYFGYSKTQDVSGMRKIGQIPAYGYTNASGIDSGVVLGCTQDNAIEARGDMFGSKVDDMDISYLVKHRCYVDGFTMSTGDSATTLLYSFPVTPGWCKFVSTEGCFQPTMTAFVASIFNFWRGGLKYKIQAAKTAYHSGRLRIVYIPGSFSTDVDSPEQAYNWIFDLRTQSEIEFSIPYNNILEWQPCNLTDQVASNTSTGTIRIEVFNELRAPDSVAQNIEFNVWISGESDLQFSVPTFQRYVPSLPGITAPFRAQVLGAAQDAGFNDMSDKPKMFETSHANRVDPCKFSIGEYVSNLRYLTRRFSPFFNLGNGEGDYVELPNYYFGSPFVFGQTLSTFKMPPLDYISYIYRFFRGGTRWKAMLSGPVTFGGYQEMILAHGVPSVRSPSTISEVLYNRFFSGTCTFAHRVWNIVNPVIEVTAPFYSQVPIRAIVGTDEPQPPFLEDSAVLYKKQVFGTNADANVEFYRAASDDFTFGWVVGPPRLRPRDGAVTVLEFGNALLNQYDAPGQTWTILTVPVTPLTLPASTTFQIAISSVASVVCAFNTTGGTENVTVPLVTFTARTSAASDSVLCSAEVIPTDSSAVFNATASFANVVALNTVSVIMYEV